MKQILTPVITQLRRGVNTLLSGVQQGCFEESDAYMLLDRSNKSDWLSWATSHADDDDLITAETKQYRNNTSNVRKTCIG